MKIKVEIPESKNDLKLSDWQRWVEIVKPDSKEKMDVDFVNRKSLEIFYGIDAKHYDSMKKRDIDKLIGALSKVLQLKAKLVTRFEMNGVQYGFIPNLEDIRMNEFVDLDKYKEPKDYHLLMSILYRPIKQSKKDEYLIEPYRGSNNSMIDMPLDFALGAMDFFFTLGLQLTNATLNCLNPKEPQQIEKRDLAVNGIGIALSSPYRITT